ncbi:MAG: hypothetical protein RRZ73_00190 [Oscillospiraceae bacterium]
MEIERKFLINKFPQLPLITQAFMEQGYISTEPVVRIRSKQTDDGTSYILCFKGKGTLVRQEIETEITEELFKQLKEFIGIPLIKKDWRLYSLDNGLELEVSCVDKGESTEFFYAEVEFESVEQAMKFVPPVYLGKEVTEDTSFTMRSFWEKKAELYK